MLLYRHTHTHTGCAQRVPMALAEQGARVTNYAQYHMLGGTTGTAARRLSLGGGRYGLALASN